MNVNMELFSAIAVIVFIFLVIFLSTGAIVWLFYIWEFNDKTARKIEIVGYFLLFVVLVWEFFVKNILFDDFYNSDFFYINEKLGVIFRMLESIVRESSIDAWEQRTHFFDTKMNDSLKMQLLTTDIIECILKVLSTVFIAIGRFQELKTMKTKDNANKTIKTKEEQNEHNKHTEDGSVC